VIVDEASGLAVYGRADDRSLAPRSSRSGRRSSPSAGVRRPPGRRDALAVRPLLGLAGVETFVLSIPGIGELMSAGVDASGFEWSIRYDTALAASLLVGTVVAVVWPLVGARRRGRSTPGSDAVPRHPK
jgi:hypothetical protein